MMQVSASVICSNLIRFYKFAFCSYRVAVKKPVGILHVNVVQAVKLLRKDILGSSDPYVKLSLTGDRLPAKKTSIKKKNLNPVWNEKFKLIVKDPNSQFLRLQVFDWDKVGGHDRIGMQLVPLKTLTPLEMKEFKLDLLKDTNVATDFQSKKQRGQLVVELKFVPFKEERVRFSGPLDLLEPKENGINEVSSSSDYGTSGSTLSGAGLLSVMIQGAEDVEGRCHNNPYALILFRGEKKKTTVKFGFQRYQLIESLLLGSHIYDTLWFLQSDDSENS